MECTVINRVQSTVSLFNLERIHQCSLLFGESSSSTTTLKKNSWRVMVRQTCQVLYFGPLVVPGVWIS